MIRKYSRLLAYTCAVPLVACLVLSLVLLHQRSSWAKAVAQLPIHEQAGVPDLEGVCSNPLATAAAEAVCSSYNRVHWFRGFSILLLCGTLLLLVAIHLSGRSCRKRRELLLTRFRFGIYVMIAASMAMVIGQSALVCVTLYYGPAEFLDRVLSGLILMTALGAVLVAYRMARLLFAFGKEPSIDVQGRLLTAQDAEPLWSLAREVAHQVGTEPPANIVAGSAPSFYVTEAKVVGSGWQTRGRTLHVSLPLCRILAPGELRAILGHEMGHFAGHDVEFSRRFYPAFRNGSDVLAAVADTANNVGGGGYALLPAISLLSYYLESFSIVEAEISRERELAADQAGASAASGRELALGLTKIVQHDSAWNVAFKRLFETGPDVKMPLPGELFIAAAMEQYAAASPAEQIRLLENECLEHPTDSHPPLSLRLKALGFSVEELYAEAGDLRPPVPAISLIPDADEMERSLVPCFAATSDEAQTVFCHHHPGFAAMEYYAGILNRSFLIYVRPEGLYGLKFAGLVTNKEPRYFDSALELLDNPWFTPGSEGFEKDMKRSRANFFISSGEIAGAEFDGTSKWGMGNIIHSGKLNIRLKSGVRRQFVLLGEAYGDGIARIIREHSGAGA